MTVPLSTTHEKAILRLRTIPWAALAGLAGALAEACGRVLTGEAAERVLDGFLRSHRDASAEQRQAAAEIVFGVGLWRRRLSWHVGAEDPATADPRGLMFALVSDLGGLPREHAWSVLELPGAPLQPREPPIDLARRYSFPDWIAAAIEAEAGGDAAALADAFNLPGPISFRANRLAVTDRAALATELRAEGVQVTEAPYAPDALIVDGRRPNIYGLQSYRRGAFEVQDEGSQLLGAIVDARPGETVLDFCAGAGGKAMQLASHMRDTGALHVYDVDLKRLERLEQRAIKAHVRRLHVHRAPPAESLQCDRVLVDAPCSELGALRRGPDLRFRISEQSVHALPPLQLDILSRAALNVRPGGTLVYATCTFLRAENEDVVERFLALHPQFALAPLPAWLAPELTRDGFLRTWPHRHGTDGFFAAVLRRVA